MTLYRLTADLALVLHVTLAFAQSTGTFTPTGNLTKPRKFHTAILLSNGKVLIAGGSSSDSEPLASSELYDPSTGTFTLSADMTAARQFHTATPLPNGKVLIAGGNNACSSSDLSTVELYDPATESFTHAGHMISARQMHTATLLDNGLVLIAGGSTGCYPYDTALVRTAELFDPATGTFTAVGDLTEPGAETAVLLSNGRVLVTRSFNFGDRTHAELYDPATHTFTRTGDLTGAYMGVRPTAILLMNGKVLIAGGSLGDLGGSEKAELYDPSTGAFSTTWRDGRGYRRMAHGHAPH